MITINDYSFRYRFAERDSLSHVSLELEAGRTLGIVGPCQAGKTTLAYAIAGVLEKHFPGGMHSGTVASDHNVPEAPGRSIGFVFQDSALQLSGVTETVEDEIAFSLEQFGMDRDLIRERVDEQIGLFGLANLRSRQPKALSGGETRILAIACEMAKHPGLLILDEPFQSLDRPNVRRLIATLKNRSTASQIIIIEQGSEIVFELCDRVLFLEEGMNRFFGSPGDLFTETKDTSSLDLPEWIEAQQILGRNSIGTSYKESTQWLKKMLSSR